MKLHEKVNDIRRAKQVPISVITQNGISKTKYFNFVRGERDLQLDDLQKLMNLLTVSFSELMAGTEEGEQVDHLPCYLIRQLTDAQIEFLINDYRQKFADTSQDRFYLMSLGLQVYLKHHRQVDYDTELQLLHRKLAQIKGFTLLEIELLTLVAPLLTPAKFFKLYEKFVAAIANFDAYTPAPVLDAILRLHHQALVLVSATRMKSLRTINFVLEAIMAQGHQGTLIEISLLQQFAQLVYQYQNGNPVLATEDFKKFLLRVQRYDAQVLFYEELAIDFAGFWQNLSAKRQHLKSDAACPFSGSVLAIRQAGRVSMNFGEALSHLAKAKGLTSQNMAKIGLTRSRIYRLSHNQSTLLTNELFDMMCLLRLEPADVTAFFLQHPESHLVDLYQLTAQSITYNFDTLLQVGTEIYENTHALSDKENLLELEFLTGLFDRDDWLTTTEAADISASISDILLKMDSFHEPEHVLAKWSLIGNYDSDQIINRLTLYDKYLHHRDLFRAPFSAVLRDGDLPLIMCLVKNDQAGYEQIFKFIKQHMMQDDFAMQFLSARWRLYVYGLYGDYFSHPEETKQKLNDFFDDFQELTNNRFISDTYHRLMTSLPTTSTAPTP